VETLMDTRLKPKTVAVAGHLGRGRFCRVHRATDRAGGSSLPGTRGK
jgi:hypothetical protein